MNHVKITLINELSLNMIRYVISNDYRGDILEYLRILWI